MGEEEVDMIKMDDDKDDDDNVDVDVVDDDDKNSKKIVAYCKTFNLIDKGNVNCGSKTHERKTKLLF